MATRSTADYIQRHMLGAHVLQSREQIWDEALRQARMSGLFLEFGVFEGRSINYFATRTERTIHGFDAFEGLPEDWTLKNPKGTFAKERLWRPPVEKNVVLHVGWFDVTLPKFIKEHTEVVSLAHIDCDLYSSTRTIFKYLAERIIPGTVIVFDEYFNYPKWQDNEFAAFQEFVREHEVQYEYLAYCPYAQVVVRIVSVGTIKLAERDVPLVALEEEGRERRLGEEA